MHDVQEWNSRQTAVAYYNYGTQWHPNSTEGRITWDRRQK